MNVLNLKTGEPFDPLPRLHHKPETSLVVSSSELSSRARGMLLAARMFAFGIKGDDMRTITITTQTARMTVTSAYQIIGELIGEGDFCVVRKSEKIKDLHFFGCCKYNGDFVCPLRNYNGTIATCTQSSNVDMVAGSEYYIIPIA